MLLWQRTCCFQISPKGSLSWVYHPLIASIMLPIPGAMFDQDCGKVVFMLEALVRRWVGEQRSRHEDAPRSRRVWDRQLCPGSSPTAEGRRVHRGGPMGEDWGGSKTACRGDEHHLLHQPDRWCLAASRRGSCVHQYTPSTHPANICEGSRYG